MSSYRKLPKIEINWEQAADFLDVIRNALIKMSKSEIEDVRLIVRSRDAVAISFDKNKDLSWVFLLTISLFSVQLQ